ncbi:16004_t:CDS:2 [Acaulospora morrowiae]|uniref:16004_t:CDS:1 n=1 Tax=Acaulospora morrowiae TaxID=94023 RepID=A0A9N8V882_9GLOM|nr:16004_t:CDS:2 [Acaulospora morrowiae]
MMELTPEFRRLVNDFSTLDGKSRKKRNDILPPIKKNLEPQDEFLKEAYRIASHISNLKSFLISVRKAYLNVSRQSPFSKTGVPLQISGGSSEQGLSSTTRFSSTTLTDKQRDEIDLQAKTIIQQCLDRIKKLEEAEQVRQNSILNNTWTKILSTAFSQEEHDVLAAIRSSVIWYLNKRLTEVSKIQKDQQEARIIREIEKRESTLYKTPTVKLHTQTQKSPLQTLMTEENEASVKNEGIISNVDEEDDVEQHLSVEQKMMLEMENETMMKELATTLEQINQAEKALTEISNLQTVLSNHLAMQTQQTDRLYAEAIATTARVQEGNTMLIKARQRASDTRKWILIFLIVASFVLLFLDWYD